MILASFYITIALFCILYNRLTGIIDNRMHALRAFYCHEKRAAAQQNYLLMRQSFIFPLRCKPYQNAPLSAKLSCNFCCEVFYLLLDTFAGFETNEALYSQVCIVLFCYLSQILSNGLLAVLCFYIYLL